MAVESRSERLIYYVAVPLTAAIAGALATALFSGQSCSLGPGTDLISVLNSSNLSGAEKMKALEVYSQVTDRPWGLVRSLTTLLFISLGLFTLPIIERLRR